MSKINYIWIHNHKKDCRAVELTKKGDWDSPWYFSSIYKEAIPISRRDKLGRKNNGGWHEWATLKCNSPVGEPCPGEIIIMLDDVLNFIPAEK